MCGVVICDLDVRWGFSYIDFGAAAAKMGLWRPRVKMITPVRRLRPLVPCLCLLAPVVPVVYFNYHTISYLLRPLGILLRRLSKIIPHYYAENMSTSELCELHGWAASKTPRNVFDAVNFCNEVDILEIRMRELMPVVTKFLVMESNAAFTGQRNRLVFNESRSRFEFAEAKLHYFFLPSRPDELLHREKEDPFVSESYHRQAMGRSPARAGVKVGDLVITAEADEIPSAHTIRLLQYCDEYPDIIHPQLRNYIC